MHINAGEIVLKIVYYGPGMSGKTTNLTVLHDRIPRDRTGTLESVTTEGDRTLFFDYMPLRIGRIQDRQVSFQVFTVPGQPKYRETRRLVLQGVDGVVFVADSGPDMMSANLQSFTDLCDNLVAMGRSPARIPLVWQYNKRDIAGAIPVSELNQQLNTMGLPYIEAEAIHAVGTMATIEAICSDTVRAVMENLLPPKPPPAVAKRAPGSTTKLARVAVRRTTHGDRPTRAIGQEDGSAAASKPAAAAGDRPRRSDVGQRRPVRTTPPPRALVRPGSAHVTLRGGPTIAGTHWREALRLVPTWAYLAIASATVIAIAAVLLIMYASP